MSPERPAGHERAATRRRRDRPLRLFVGIHPPAATARALAEGMASLELPPCRATPVAQIHLTLQFLGDTDARALPRIEESLARSCAGIGPFALQPVAWVALPTRGAARLIAARTDAPAPLLELQRRLATRLAARPRRRPGDRFLPHLTVCRFRSPVRELGALPALVLPPFPVRCLRLVRSRLTPEGALHEIEREVGLSPG